MRVLVLLFASFLCLHSINVYAQITVIQDDGSVVVFDPSSSSSQEPSEGHTEVSPQKEPPLAEDIKKPSMATNDVLQEKALEPAVKKEGVKGKSYLKAKRDRARKRLPVPASKPMPPLSHRTSTALPKAGPVTKDMAVSIALEHAPPAKSIIVQNKVTPDGTPVFAVVFKTEDGSTEIVVEKDTGKVLGFAP